MSTAVDLRLQFALNYFGFEEVQSITGIAESRLTNYASGAREVPPMYYSAVRRVYQQSAYHMMRDQGFSVSQSDRFKWYSPDTVLSHLKDVQEQQEYLAQGALQAKITKLEAAGESYDVYDLYSSVLDAIQEGFRHSQESLEAWLEYGK